MKTLELKHLACYLPYGLKYQLKGNFPIKEGVENIIENIGEISPFDFTLRKVLDWKTCKPILRPLSDLTKPCLPDGKTPIVELSKIAFQNIYATTPYFLTHEQLDEGDSAAIIAHTSDERVSLSYDKDLNRNEFTFFISGSEMDTNQLQLFEKLFEWHFDVYNLIEGGLAVDINTLSKQQ